MTVEQQQKSREQWEQLSKEELVDKVLWFEEDARIYEKAFEKACSFITKLLFCNQTAKECFVQSGAYTAFLDDIKSDEYADNIRYFCETVKADEDKVRKETAEHILGALYDITFEREWDEVNGDHDEQKEVVSRAALKNIAKNYGVELPE